MRKNRQPKRNREGYCLLSLLRSKATIRILGHSSRPIHYACETIPRHLLGKISIRNPQGCYVLTSTLVIPTDFDFQDLE